VNGWIEWGSYAVHTRYGLRSWFLVDLEGSFRLDEVRVFGRGDGFFVDPTPPPISVDLSADGRRFQPAGACDPVVTQVSPCRVRLGGAPARYLRLSRATHLVLSEVEVFAAR
jgi:hypothetical protein